MAGTHRTGGVLFTAGIILGFFAGMGFLAHLASIEIERTATENLLSTDPTHGIVPEQRQVAGRLGLMEIRDTYSCGITTWVSLKVGDHLEAFVFRGNGIFNDFNPGDPVTIKYRSHKDTGCYDVIEAWGK